MHTKREGGDASYIEMNLKPRSSDISTFNHEYEETIRLLIQSPQLHMQVLHIYYGMVEKC